ncbi:MAG TPA: glycosyltransferase family 2 protein [Friedmanniella sp.]
MSVEHTRGGTHSSDGAPAREGRAPRLTLGLPVYNGERFLAESLDALLAQTFADFELIISDNASADGTRAIAEAYAERDPRVRYVRHPVNRGSTFNHNFVIHEARGELFKWVSDDDLYAPELLQRCIEALDARPEVTVAHAWTAYVDDRGELVDRPPYPLVTDVPDPAARLHSLLVTQGGDDIYGVIRMSVLSQVELFGSYHMADRTFVAELLLHGPFHNVPDYLYFRRDHPGRASRVGRFIRRRCSHLDPARANRWRHPMVRLLGEYVLGFVTAVARAPLSRSERLRCYLTLAGWLVSHVNPMYRSHMAASPDPAFAAIGEGSLAARVTERVRGTSVARLVERRRNDGAAGVGS